MRKAKQKTVVFKSLKLDMAQSKKRHKSLNFKALWRFMMSI